MENEVLRMQGITKIYSNGFVANKDVTFGVEKGEIHALVGENGAGKTTLMKILFGMERHEEGSILINGEEVHITSPLDSIAKGIGMVHQHFMLVPSLTVAENVVLGVEPMSNGLFDFDAAVKETQRIADKYNFDVDAKTRVRDLSVGQMQKVEILKALVKGAKILIMDEPTAVLTPQETRELFEQLQILKEDGHSIIFISHKLEEVMEICSRVTVLRHGRCLGTYDIRDMTEAKISRLMVGRDVVLKMDKPQHDRGEVVLELDKVVKINSIGKRVLNGLSLTVRKGEIVGIAGVEGNGQSELASAICGLDRHTAGTIKINGVDIGDKAIKEIRDLGLAVISEDRMVDGVAADRSVRENIMSDRFDKPEFKKGIFMDNKRINQMVDECIQEFEIACDDRDQPVRMLSGGNIQKVVVAREFTSGRNVVLACQPTRGIDVGTAEMIRKYIIKMTREKDAAVLLISADLNEVLECSDRLLVMRYGKIVGAFNDAKEVTEDILGEYMLGIKTMSDEELEAAL